MTSQSPKAVVGADDEGLAVLVRSRAPCRCIVMMRFSLALMIIDQRTDAAKAKVDYNLGDAVNRW